MEKEIDINDEECTILISNSKYWKKFKNREEAFSFIEKNCPFLWTRLFKLVEDKWVACGSVLPQSRD